MVKRKSRGRRAKPLTAADRQLLHKYGMLPPRFSKRRRLENMKLDFGFLNAILTERERKKYKGKILLKDKKDTGKKPPHAYELSEMHKVLLRCVLNGAWARMQIHEPEPQCIDRGWLLVTRGECLGHVDHDKPGFFSLLICLHTAAPYQMVFSANKVRFETSETPSAPWKTVTMQTCSYLLFPSSALHRCVTDEENRRVILNVLLERSIKKKKKSPTR